MRKLVNEEYLLDQNFLVGMLSNVWASTRPNIYIHHNDHIRVFSIAMTIDEHRYMYQRLVEGCTSCCHVDHPLFLPKQIYQTTTLFSTMKM